MKKVVIFGLVIILAAALFFVRHINLNTPIQFISPILKGKVLGINLWLPQKEKPKETEVLTISAEAAYFVDIKSGQLLYSKNGQKKLPIASLAKIMTVVIALEHKNLDDKFLVSKRAAEMEPDKMLLIEGEKMTLKELLYGIFLISANDAAEVLAEGATGDRDEFLKLMNIRAKQLGMNNTYFANPTGLDEERGNSYSSAYDLAILTRYLTRNYPEVVEISKTPHIYIDRTDEHQDYDMYTGINLITTYPGVVGFKTGYTPEAGLTLITLAQKNGHEVIGVLLGSQSRRDEARELLDYSFKKLGS